MKFGQNLPHNQVPEWTSAYIDYKGLKKLIKSALVEATPSGDTDVTSFFYTLDRQLENVDAFYNRKYAELSRRLRVLQERYGLASELKDSMDKDELQDVVGTLLELRGQHRKLQWYGEVNRQGFVKITKKLDKKVSSSPSQSRYIATKVDPKAFATNYKVILDLRNINDWLSALSEVRSSDDASSVHSSYSGSLHRISSRATLGISATTTEAIEVAVRGDDTLSLSELVSTATGAGDALSTKYFMLDLLRRAVVLRAVRCIKWLLGRVDSIDGGNDMNERNCLHHLLISFGRARAMEEDQQKSTNITAAQAPAGIANTFEVLERDPSTTLGRDDPRVILLLYILDQLSTQQRSAVIARDVYGRTPLHYAAQYGLVAACEELLKHMHSWELRNSSVDIESKLWEDWEGCTPLHLAVIGRHYRTTRALLQLGSEREVHKPSTSDRRSALLLLATSHDEDRIVELLVQAGVDVNHCDAKGETSLHIAARVGHTKCARILLDAALIDYEKQEKNFGWTPLFVASVDGHLPILNMLLEAGAKADKVDSSGWTAKEHAALRGHMDIARRLAAVTVSPGLSPAINGRPGSSSASPHDQKSSSLQEKNGMSRVPEPLKEFGHRYLKDESMILLSLGTMDPRKKSSPVNLDSIALADAHTTQLDTALSIVVSAQGASCETSIIDLPVRENISTSPVSFTAKDPTKVKILFDLVPTYAGSTSKVIARAVAMLSSIKPSVGSKRASLQGNVSVPLLAADTLDIIGSIDFNFLIITPFQHPNLAVSEETTYWRSTSTMIIGHRGLGKNVSSKGSLQLGENTIQSFVTAANLGASYVEFDVQLTKDLVPIIYHDFLVAETGADVPVHTLTLEQFMQLKGENKLELLRRRADSGRPHRSYSLGGTDEKDVPEMRERMKHTRALKEKGFKANSRGDFIQSPFTTLEEMFHKVPQSVGFNIEMKYPTLLETEQHELDTYAVELNTFVDQVLKLVYTLGQKRNIVFSSFHPDVCLMLAFKQPSIPVLFLTDAGVSQVDDIRASSLQEAIRFASRWKLLGIVSAAEPMVLCPRLIRVVKESGLVCVTYGTLNNDVHNSRLQAQEGIDAVIVDSVLKVRKGLTDAEVVTDVAVAKHGSKANDTS